jgi:general secretion pathway protein D
MMAKKEFVVFISVGALMLLAAMADARAEAESDPNAPMINNPNNAVVDSNQPNVPDSNDLATKADDTKIGVDPNTPKIGTLNTKVAPDLEPSRDPNSNNPAIEADDMEMFDPNWADGFNVERVKVVLNFQDALVSDVLDYLSREAGLIIISDALISGRINLVSKRPLNIDEVIALINSVLQKEGYAAIRTGRTLKIISLTAAKTSNIPVITANKPEDIVEGDNVVTCIIPIRYADAIRLKDDITPLLSDYAVISSNEASNSLIITDTTANIKRLVKIVKSVDTQMSTVADIKVFLLKYADARSTAQLINEVFKQQSSSSGGRNQTQNQNPFMRMMEGRGGRGRGGDGGGQQQSETGGAAQNVPVVASADDRTNAVVVSGPADVLVIIEQVVKELDLNPDEDHQLFVYKLKYAQAANIKDRLNSLFQELENINQQNLRNSGGGRSGGGNQNASTSSNSSTVTDEVYIEADEDTNALIIMTSSKNYEKIKKIIEDLDIPIPQVLIKVLLAELTTTDNSDIGIDWTVESVNSDGDLVSNSFTYSPQATEGLASHIIQGDLDVTLRALQEVGSLNVLSRPYIMTSNNQTATINVGQRFPFITDSQITDQGTTYNTVDYENIGITLEVTPSINIDGLVIMDVNPEITTPLTDTVKISEAFDATIFATRSAQCRVAVPNGQTVVIGGLMQDNDSESSEKIPVLGDLPLLGGLFKRTVTEKEKTELLIFLTPQVAKNIEDLKKISEHERSKSKFLNEMQGTTLQEHVENMESVYQENSLAE